MNPLPDFFIEWLTKLSDDQNSKIYDAVCAGQAFANAVMDIVSPRATANPE